MTIIVYFLYLFFLINLFHGHHLYKVLFDMIMVKIKLPLLVEVKGDHGQKAALVWNIDL